MVAGALRRVANIWTGIRDRRTRPFTQNASVFNADGPTKTALNKTEFYTFIARDGRRSISDVNREFAKLAFGTGKLTLGEYVRYRLYDPDGLTFEEKQRFLSESLHWQLVSKVSNPIYDALTQDKYISYQWLAASGLPVPNTLAVVTTGPRVFPNVPTLRSAGDLFRFVAGAETPLFFKANLGIGSFAAFICDGVEGGALVTRPHGRKAPEEVIDLIGGRDFLIQEMIANHEELEPITSAVSTIRMTNFLVDGQVHTPVALMKLAAEDAIADNFWRAGNMLAEIDMMTGQIRRVVRGHGLAMELRTEAPKSGQPLIGFKIPFWREIVELNEKCALILATIPFNSLDIAVTASGPIIVEVNTGGSFDLPQLASGRGILTPEVKSLFELH